MCHIYADDGRVLTPPHALQPQLKNAFHTFTEIIGHIRFYYMADEIWDGKSSLVFSAGGPQIAAITLEDGRFSMRIAEMAFSISDDTLLETVFETLRQTVPGDHHRPTEQITIDLTDPSQFPCGRRCDLCLGSKKSNPDDFSESVNFGYMNWLCYHNCVPSVGVIERWDGVFNCPGCIETRKTQDCKYFHCPTKKGHAHCAACGEYHTCDVYNDSHYPGQCNLGLTADEVSLLVLPYAVKERLDLLRDAIKTKPHTVCT